MFLVRREKERLTVLALLLIATAKLEVLAPMDQTLCFAFSRQRKAALEKLS